MVHENYEEIEERFKEETSREGKSLILPEQVVHEGRQLEVKPNNRNGKRTAGVNLYLPSSKTYAEFMEDIWSFEDSRLRLKQSDYEEYKNRIKELREKWYRKLDELYEPEETQEVLKWYSSLVSKYRKRLKKEERDPEIGEFYLLENVSTYPNPLHTEVYAPQSGFFTQAKDIEVDLDSGYSKDELKSEGIELV